MTRLVLATGNPHKTREIEPLLAAAGVELVPVAALTGEWHVEETGRTLEDNARLKALAAVRATGFPAVGDDTGLFVDALSGAPGVHSSRYAGERASYADNVAKLLRAMEGAAEGARAARFRTIAVLARPDGEERVFAGELAGRICRAPRGEGGFGYDPVFELLETGRTLAELLLEEKNVRSHRARAFAALGRFLVGSPEWLGGDAAV
ncbi:MAG TPA: RdgB/HAM1 family non-canonical purine NTP pyrophosphatase [Gemmatimonadota bacterium]|nr:RdgB/HAM1 family non-canonical purine NTP pyrophosphatase [Gemmatimonadota bacterium]